MAATLPESLYDHLPPYLGAQRWYSGTAPPPRGQVRVDSVVELWAAPRVARRLWQLIVSVGDDHYQLLLGERPAGEEAEFLRSREEAVLGASDRSYFYDATVDSDMARRLLEVASGGKESATFARPLAAEQSNTSLVFDDRVILKLFRRLHPGRNPDVEVTEALAGAGFGHVAAPLVHWHDDQYDLAFGQQFLAGGSDGWALALTSLRDLFSGQPDLPREAGGDFGSEAERLGRVTAEMHLAMRQVFGTAGPDAGSAGLAGLRSRLEAGLASASEVSGRDLRGAAAPLLARLAQVGDQGPVLRIHGDYHLGQVMRTDSGWYVLDFEGEPRRSLEERTAPASALKDVTGMLRSFHYASMHALAERDPAYRDTLEPLARAWVAHNRQAFLEGYSRTPGIHDVLPDAGSAPAVLTAYELDKALYELGYERHHRPEWVSIPLDAIYKLTYGGGAGEGS